MSFSKLKEMSANSVETLRKQMEELNTKTTSYVDEDADKFWKLTIDKAGNGTAIIRFLPAMDGETSNFVRVFRHSFKGPTGLWYINNSLSTIGKPDPVGELNRELWNSGEEYKKEIARKQKRLMSIYTNILVIKDPANPSNDGKVFYYEFGKQILDKIMDASTKRDELYDRVLFDPFNLWTGANFRLRAKKQDNSKWPTYVTSDFDPPKQLFESDEALEAVWKQCLPLYKFIDPTDTKRYKPYDELKSRLMQVVGSQPLSSSVTPDNVADPEEEMDEDDEDLALFNRLAKAD